MSCNQCGQPVNSGRFCPSCGAPVSSSPQGIFEARAGGNQIEHAFQELKLIGLKNLLPFEDWLKDKPWNLTWVRWFVAIALFPLCLAFWASSAQLDFRSIAFLFGAYFALMWAVVLYFMLRPKLAFARIAQVGLFTVVCGISLVLLLQQAPFFSSLYSATASASIFGKLIGFVFGVGILEETAKALPIWWIYIHRHKEDSLNTIVFLGCISGFAFGVAEAANYSLSYALGLGFGRLGFGDYLLLQLTRFITLPLLHAIWSGIFAYFIALGCVNRRLAKGLVLAGILVTATLHGLYDAFSDSVLGVAIAVVSILIFVAYYRSGETLQSKLGVLAAATRDSSSAVAGEATHSPA